jgi:hypothetical protein
MDNRRTFESDFDFTLTLLSDFFAQKRIRSTLTKIADAEVTGWEKWWQIELAMFMSEYDDIAEWNIEEEFLTDRRQSTTKDFIAIDICFRRKRHASDRLVFLELKQDLDWKRCILNMLRDAEKFYSGHTRSLLNAEVRSFFLAGVYLRMPKAEVHDYIEDAAQAREIDWDLMDTRYIADTPFGFTLL